MLGRYLTALTLSAAGVSSALGDTVLVDFGNDFDITRVQCRDVEVAIAAAGEGTALRVRSGHAQEWPGITLVPEGAPLDISASTALEMDLRNVGDNAVQVGCRVDNVGADGVVNCLQESATVAAGGAAVLRVAIPAGSRPTQGGQPIQFIGMRGAPGTTRVFDPTKVIALLVFVPRPTEDHVFEIDSIRLTGHAEPAHWPDPFLPMIDEFGQFRHADWPGKVHSLDELRATAKDEERDLGAHPGSPEWDRWGGWAEGPSLEATGAFRAQKHQGKWWLVDPDGKLFWSHGIDCVGCEAATPTDDREAYFAWLPKRDEPFGAFWGRGYAGHGYYTGRQLDTYDFARANAERKYGPEWEARVGDASHRRLRSWGLNTIGNWSDGAISRMDRTPYTVAVHFGGPILQGSEGYWGQFRDVFDPGFEGAVRGRMAEEEGTSASDPWCIGYFVDNEISWGDGTSLASAALASPPEQAAKKAFVEDLKARYGDIARLNEAWGTGHASWESVLAATTGPDPARARADLLAFDAKTADRYFSVIQSAVKDVAPDRLYLGCRFAWANPQAVAVAARYCDVMSFNIYSRTVEGWMPPADIDMPVIVGEFHFGALDRGMFHTGLVAVENQAARADQYREYVTAALRHPLMVGTHWFKYQDEPTTGRPLDEENYQIGFIDICGTPYPETIEACREVGYSVYSRRSAD